MANLFSTGLDERRRHTRYTVMLPVAYLEPGGDLPAIGTLIELSAGGGSLQLGKELGEGTRLLVKVRLTEGDLILRAVVRRETDQITGLTSVGWASEQKGQAAERLAALLASMEPTRKPRIDHHRF